MTTQPCYQWPGATVAGNQLHHETAFSVPVNQTSKTIDGLCFPTKYARMTYYRINSTVFIVRCVYSHLVKVIHQSFHQTYHCGLQSHKARHRSLQYTSCCWWPVNVFGLAFLHKTNICLQYTSKIFCDNLINSVLLYS